VAVGSVSCTAEQPPRTPSAAKEIFDLAAAIHDTADASFQERDVEGDEQSESSFKCF
jgi:hypothetical protein